MQGVIRVGVAVIAFNDGGAFLMGKRLNTHGAGAWAVPGGTLEYGESFADCARREMREETGLEIEHIETLAVANHVFPDHNKQFIAVYCAARIIGDQTPQMLEPDKYVDLRFFDDWRALPQPVFVAYADEVPAALVAQYRQKHVR